MSFIDWEVYKGVVRIQMLRSDLIGKSDFINDQIKDISKRSTSSFNIWMKETVECARFGIPLPWEKGYIESCLYLFQQDILLKTFQSKNTLLS